MNNKKTTLLVTFLLTGMLIALSPARAQDYTFNWAKGIIAAGGTSNTSDDVGASGLTVDRDGNVYSVGGFTCDSADFDPGSGTDYLYSPGGNRAFISKLDPQGNHVWAKTIQGITDNGAADIVTDTLGNLYVLGNFMGTADFDPGSNTAMLTAQGNTDIFVLKLDQNGEYVWVRGLGGIDMDSGNDMALDAYGNIYFTGRFKGTADFDPGPNTVNLTSNGDVDAFVCKLDQDGNYVWAKTWGGPGLDWSASPAVDAAGNVYATGVFWYTVDFDPGSNTANLSAGSFAAYVLKLDAAGDYLWAKSLSGATSAGYDVVTGHAGVYITGTFDGSVDFDPGSNVDIIAGNNYDIFIWKLDLMGNYQWAKSVGGLDYDMGNDIAIDAVDNVYTLINFWSDTVDFDPGAGTAHLMSRGGGDIAILKLDPLGNYLWSGSTGCSEVDYTGAIAVASGNIYMASQFYDTIDGDPTPGDFPIAPYSDGFYPGGVVISKVLCGDTSSSALTMDTCGAYAFGGRTFTESGTYAQILSGVLGCDSTVTLHLTISELEPVITVDEFVLGTVETYDSYQWILNGEPIPGATNSSYTVLENGDYQVIVTNGSCTGTSEIYIVENVSIEDLDFGLQVRIYPNPAQGIVYIQAPIPVDVMLMGVEGRIIREVKQAKSISVSDLSAGIYLLKITNARGEGVKVERLVKQK